jgi:hypothetical protein
MDEQRSPFLRQRDAAAFLALSERTLEAMRVRGGGPVFRHHGRIVVYRREDLEAWSAAGARASTSERPAHGHLR